MFPTCSSICSHNRESTDSESSLQYLYFQRSTLGVEVGGVDEHDLGDVLSLSFVLL